MITGSASALESHLRPRLFRVADLDGRQLGTGFAVGGAVLTCAHVAGDYPIDQLRVEDTRVVSRIVGKESDAVLLKLDRDVGGLAISTVRPQAVLAAGYPSEPGLTGALFTASTIEGSTSICYAVRNRTYELAEVWTLSGVLVSPGFSGGPVLDRASGAVAGMTVANLELARGGHGPSGFVLPIAAVLNDGELGQHLVHAERETPRFGPHPNRLAAVSWCQAATAAEIARMSGERLYDAERVVFRGQLVAELQRFLQGPARVWAVVDRSGLGKSTALASIANTILDRPVVLVRAMEVDGPAGLTELVQAKLTAVKPRYFDEVPDLAGLASPGGPEPLVIIDGLNESPLGQKQMRDRWLPQAVRDAGNCKLIISSRPEAWERLRERIKGASFHRIDNNREGDDPAYRIGEFTEEEQHKFIADRFHGNQELVRRLRNPLLLGMAADLGDKLQDRRLSRWHLIASWVARDCAHAVDEDDSVSARIVEDTLERVASTCLREGTRTVSRSHPIVREPGFEALLRQHLLVSEGDRYGFRYDILYEHLAARSLDMGELDLRNDGWRFGGNPIDWAIVVAFCERMSHEGSEADIDRMWGMLDGFDGKSGWNVTRCIAALPMPPERELLALSLFERSAREGFWSFSLIEADLANADWRPEFSRAVLRLAVRAASGYDFRANDLSIAMRFRQSQGQFEVQGYRNFVKSLLGRDRSETLSALGEWHTDEEKLGVIWNDTTRESTISSWTSCCFVYCADLFSDDELVSAPTAQHSGEVFRGLALSDAQRLQRLARLMVTAPHLDARRFRYALSALNGMAQELDEPLGEECLSLACELALVRFSELGHDGFMNSALTWCAGQKRYQDEAWRLFVELVEERRAESITLQAFLPHRPDDVLALVERLPNGFVTQSGSVMLDLAKSPFGASGPVSQDTAELRTRILRQQIDVHGFNKIICDVIEDVLYALTPEQVEELGVADLAVQAIRTGAVAKPIVYFAGDQNARKTGSGLDLADRLARCFAEECPDPDLTKKVLMLRLVRAWHNQGSASELQLIGEIASLAAARFGPQILVAVLSSTGGLCGLVDEERACAIMDAVRGETQDHVLDRLIQDILDEHFLSPKLVL